MSHILCIMHFYVYIVKPHIDVKCIYVFECACICLMIICGKLDECSLGILLPNISLASVAWLHSHGPDDINDGY